MYTHDVEMIDYEVGVYLSCVMCVSLHVLCDVSGLFRLCVSVHKQLGQGLGEKGQRLWWY